MADKTNKEQTQSDRFHEAYKAYMAAAVAYRDLPSGPNEAAARAARDTFRAIRAELDAAAAARFPWHYSKFIVKDS